MKAAAVLASAVSLVDPEARRPPDPDTRPGHRRREPDQPSSGGRDLAGLSAAIIGWIPAGTRCWQPARHASTPQGLGKSHSKGSMGSNASGAPGLELSTSRPYPADLLSGRPYAHASRDHEMNRQRTSSVDGKFVSTLGSPLGSEAEEVHGRRKHSWMTRRCGIDHSRTSARGDRSGRRGLARPNYRSEEPPPRTRPLRRLPVAAPSAALREPGGP